MKWEIDAEHLLTTMCEGAYNTIISKCGNDQWVPTLQLWWKQRQSLLKRDAKIAKIQILINAVYHGSASPALAARIVDVIENSDE